jgi:hypothetical protein
MAQNNFLGMFPLFIDFNTSLYELFSHAPNYIGKIFVGLFYGIILGFLISFWRNEITYNAILLSSSLWILSFLNCITIEWEQIFFLLGISGRRISLSEVGNFFNTYFIECGIALVIAIIFYKTVRKYHI